MPEPAILTPCPWLPPVEGMLDFRMTRRHGDEKGSAYYLDALRYAQSLWLSGKSAQALLQLNKAWMADLAPDDPVLSSHPPPYTALMWMMRRAADGGCGFLGDPVRHFQHLASRMSGPRAEPRAWRAWLCMHLARHVLPCSEFHADGPQLAREGLWVPSWSRALSAIATCGWPGESTAAEEARTARIA
jgi:hypothetical protein